MLSVDFSSTVFRIALFLVISHSRWLCCNWEEDVNIIDILFLTTIVLFHILASSCFRGTSFCFIPLSSCFLARSFGWFRIWFCCFRLLSCLHCCLRCCWRDRIHTFFLVVSGFLVVSASNQLVFFVRIADSLSFDFDSESSQQFMDQFVFYLIISLPFCWK